MKNYLLIILLFSISEVITAQNNKQYIIKNCDINDQHSTFGTSFFGNNFIYFSSPKKRLQYINKRKRERLARRLKRMSKKRRLRVLQRKERLKTNIIRRDFEFYLGIVNKKGDIIKNQRLSHIINTNKGEIDLVFTKNLKIVYFTRNISKKKNTSHLALFKADVISTGYWVNIKPLPFNSKYYSVGHPTLSQDDRTLYFTSDMEGTLGSLDIFKVRITGENSYSKPINLGNKVNTIGEETTPFILNNTLYFSSNGKGGLGDLDIFSVNLSMKDNAINLGQPFNSIKNDLAFTTLPSTTQGYFTSNRPNGKGKYDIYSFKEEEDDDDEKKEEKEKEIVIQKKDSITKKEIVIVKTTPIKHKNKTIEEIKKVEISVNKDGTLTINEFKKCNALLNKLNNVYFDYDKVYIRADAARELDNVISIMRQCPNIEILVASHTDSRSSYKYNKNLSQRRAESTVEYILRNGHFTPKRIKGIGYGESRPKNKCSNGVVCSEIEHQINRRTEFEISNFY